MRRIATAIAAAIALVAMPAVTAQAAPAPQPRAKLHQQVITVKVAHPWSTSGVLETWEWNGSRYVRTRGPISAYVGSDGVGSASEYVSRTPAGVFTLTEAFGRLPDPGAHLKYRKAGMSSWWVSDVNSAKYNTFQRCSPGDWCGFDQGPSEQLGAISVYSYAIVIDYNRRPPVPGKGSAFFLHVSGGAPTAGCVSIDSGNLVSILRWLQPIDHPVISIGVGDKAYAAIS